MAKNPSEIGASAAGKAKALGKVMKGETGILRQLAEEHGEVAMLMQRVSGSSSGSDARAELFPMIRENLLAHAKAEERTFYPVLREHAGLRDLVERSLGQHREVEALLDELTAGDPSSDAWHSTFERMKRSVEEHVALEEQEVFPLAKDLLDSDDRSRILESYETEHDALLRRAT